MFYANRRQMCDARNHDILVQAISYLFITVLENRLRNTNPINFERIESRGLFASGAPLV